MSKAMFISVGGSPDPIIKSVDEHKPDFVCFLVSVGERGSKKEVNANLKEGEIAKKGHEGEGAIIQKIIHNFEYCIIEVIDPQNLVECYKSALNGAKLIQKRDYAPSDVIVDYTGGTKSMSAALVLATISENYTFSYVGCYKRDKRGLGIVISGSEEVFRYDNPWKVFAVKDMENAVQYFNSRHFLNALNNLKNAEKRLSAHPKEFQTASNMRRFIKCYLNWDLFQHKGALDLISECYRTSQQFNASEQTKQNIEIITKLKGKEPSIYYIVDLLQNAKRRASEGRYDDSVARLYRTIELIAQYQLQKKFKIKSNNVDLKKIPETLQDKYKKEFDDRDGKIKLGLFKDYDLLKDLGDDLGNKFYNDKQLQELLKIRNQSILAHGLDPISKEDFECLFKIVHNFASYVIPNLEDLESKAEFPKIKL